MAFGSLLDFFLLILSVCWFCSVVLVFCYFILRYHFIFVSLLFRFIVGFGKWDKKSFDRII